MPPTVREVQRRLIELKVEDVLNLNIFDETIPALDEQVWTCSRATLHRIMQSQAFVFDEQITYYEYTKQQEYAVSMHDNYLEWIQNYRMEEYQICYHDETCMFKSVVSKKIW